MVSSWLLLIGLFALMANSLQDLNVDSERRNDKAAWEWTLDKDDSNGGRLALPTTAGPSEIAQLPPGGGGGDVMSSDIIISNGSGGGGDGGGGGGCASNNNGRSRRRIRARDENSSCVEKNFLPFSSSGEEEENGRHQLLLPAKPNAQQQGGGGGRQNRGGGSGVDPEFRVVLPRVHDLLQFLFIPRENRPTRDSEVCPDPSRPFPICGRPGDTYVTSNRVTPGLVVDPAYLYLPVAECMSVEGDRIGYCCQYADAAYAWEELNKIELGAWRVLLQSGGDMLRKVEERLMSGARAPYKLVGLDCKPIELEGTEGRRAMPF